MQDDRASDPSRRPTVAEWATIMQHFDRLCDVDERKQNKRLTRMRLSPFVTDEIKRLLAGGRNHGILDRLVLPAANPLHDEPPTLPLGSQIDGFRIERLIGRGGVGDVYLATRSKDGFTQRVALKLLRPDTIMRREAFDAERALVAGLDHPGIARLIDGGTGPDGRPYMVLDFIEGDPITAWCGSHDAALDKRLQLFLEVCQAVAYAHSRLIVHNDIKPGNILIDRVGRARLLDFGIAKIADEHAHRTEPSATGDMLTLGYAAPEQLAGEETTTATDIYALGALLFELLVGRTPWKLSRTSVQTILHRMGDDLPIPPSRADALPGKRLFAQQKLAGDLDAIVAKAMQDAPQLRYATVDALAEDIRRHLARVPILARSTSRRYRTWRFVQRHRWPLAAGMIAIVALVGGSGYVAWQAHRTAIERDIAIDQARRAEAANQALELMFRDIGDSKAMQRISVGEMLGSITARMLDSPPDSPDAAPIIAALSSIYLITENNADAQALLEGALKRGIGSRDPVNTARLKLKLGTILATQGRITAATRLLDDADRIWRSDPERFLSDSVEAVSARAMIAKLEGRPQEAIRLLELDMPAAARVYFTDDRDYAARAATLATLYADSGRINDAIRVLHDAHDAMARPDRPPSLASLNTSRLEADMLNRSGQPERATVAMQGVIASRRRYHGPSVALAVDLLYLARILNARSLPAPALLALDEAEPMAIEHFGPYSQPVAQIRISKTDALARLGRIAEARTMLASIDPVASRLNNGSVNEVRYLRMKALLAILSGRRAEGAQQLAAVRAMAIRSGHGADAALFEIRAAEKLIASKGERPAGAGRR